MELSQLQRIFQNCKGFQNNSKGASNSGIMQCIYILFDC